MPSAAKQIMTMTSDEKPKNGGRYWEDFLFVIGEIRRLRGERVSLLNILKGRDPDFDFTPYEDPEETEAPTAKEVILRVLTEAGGSLSRAEIKARAGKLEPTLVTQFDRSTTQMVNRKTLEERDGIVRVPKHKR